MNPTTRSGAVGTKHQKQSFEYGRGEIVPSHPLCLVNEGEIYRGWFVYTPHAFLLKLKSLPSRWSAPHAGNAWHLVVDALEVTEIG